MQCKHKICSVASLEVQGVPKGGSLVGSLQAQEQGGHHVRAKMQKTLIRL